MLLPTLLSKIPQVQYSNGMASEYFGDHCVPEILAILGNITVGMLAEELKASTDLG